MHCKDDKECIAVGTNLGQIYYVEIQGHNYAKDIAYQLPDEAAVTAISSDPKTKTLAIGTSTG